MKRIKWTATALCFAGIGGSFAAAQEDAVGQAEPAAVPRVVIEREAEVKTGGETVLIEIGKVPSSTTVRVLADVLNSSGVSLVAKVVPKCNCTASVPEFEMPTGQRAKIAFDISTDAETRMVDVPVSLHDASKDFTFQVVVRYVSVHPVALGKTRVIVPSGKVTQIDVPVLSNFDGVVVKQVTVDSEAIHFCEFKDGKATFNVAKAVDAIEAQAKVTVTCESLGAERVVELPLQIGYLGVMKVSPSVIRLRRSPEGDLRASLLARGYLDDAAYSKARVSMLDRGKELDCKIVDAVRRGESVFFLSIILPPEAQDASDAARLRVQVDGLVSEAEVKN